MHPTSQSNQRGARATWGAPELTPREAEVLFWMSKGKSNHDIGVILGAKTGTICKHVGHILTKLNVENRTSAAVVALEARRSVAGRSQSESARLWTVVAAVIAMQFAELSSDAFEFCDVLPSFFS